MPCPDFCVQGVGEQEIVCAKCKQQKPLSAFHKDRSRASGVYAYCRECVKNRKCALCKSECDQSTMVAVGVRDKRSDGLVVRGLCRDCAAEVANAYSWVMARQEPAPAPDAERVATIRARVLQEVAEFCEFRAGPGPEDDTAIRGQMFSVGWWRALTTTAGIIRADQMAARATDAAGEGVSE